jgi:large subunit ribosomal protein L22
MKAIIRNVRISPKKANLVAELVRGQRVTQAENILEFTPKKGADILKKLLESAVANAENNFKQKKDDLVIREIKVSKGFTLKRFRPVSRGRAHPILKKASHIHLILENIPAEKKAKKATPAKTESKTEETKAAPEKKASTKKTAAKKAPAKKETKPKK